jgi:hypothetical protein
MPFMGATLPQWTVEFRSGLTEVTVEPSKRTIEVSDADTSRGVIAGLCTAAGERADMVAVHAAACALGSRCLLFVAPPGGGKSTLATLMHDATLLSDELVILQRRESSTTMAFGTPVRSACPRNPTAGPATVSAILFLRKAFEDRLQPVEESVALEELLGQTWAAPGIRGAVALKRAQQVLSGIPSYHFYFRNDSSCVKLLVPLLADPA